jgi:hypothetical protein
MVAVMERCMELTVSVELRTKLLSISAATIDRLLAPDRARLSLSGRPGNKPGTLLKHQTPVRTFSDWDDAVPKPVEIDIVGHEDGVFRGEYCQILDVTSAATGWTESRAVWNKPKCTCSPQSGRSGLPCPPRCSVSTPTARSS